MPIQPRAEPPAELGRAVAAKVAVRHPQPRPQLAGKKLADLGPERPAGGSSAGSKQKPLLIVQERCVARDQLCKRSNRRCYYLSPQQPFALKSSAHGPHWLLWPKDPRQNLPRSLPMLVTLLQSCFPQVACRSYRLLEQRRNQKENARFLVKNLPQITVNYNKIQELFHRIRLL